MPLPFLLCVLRVFVVICFPFALLARFLLTSGLAVAQQKAKRLGKGKASPPPAGTVRDAKETQTGLPLQPRDPELAKYGIYEQTAPRPAATSAVTTALPLELKPGDHIAFIGNTLFERSQLFGHFEALLHQRFPRHQLVVRNLSWSADEIDLAAAAGQLCRRRAAPDARDRPT